MGFPKNTGLSSESFSLASCGCDWVKIFPKTDRGTPTWLCFKANTAFRLLNYGPITVLICYAHDAARQQPRASLFREAFLMQQYSLHEKSKWVLGRHTCFGSEERFL